MQLNHAQKSLNRLPLYAILASPLIQKVWPSCFEAFQMACWKPACRYIKADCILIWRGIYHLQHFKAITCAKFVYIIQNQWSLYIFWFSLSHFWYHILVSLHYLCFLQLVNHVYFSPDGQWVASASFDKSVKLWNGITGKFVAAFRGHVGPVYQIRLAFVFLCLIVSHPIWKS